MPMLLPEGAVSDIKVSGVATCAATGSAAGSSELAGISAVTSAAVSVVYRHAYTSSTKPADNRPSNQYMAACTVI